MTGPDVAVLGGGHNGLVAAAWLASRGASVTVLEARSRLGGWAGTLEIEGGTAPVAAHDLRLHPTVLEALGTTMEELGVRPRARIAELSLDGGQRLELWADRARSRASFEAVLGAAAGRQVDSLVGELSQRASELEALLLEAEPTRQTLGRLALSSRLVAFATASLKDLLEARFDAEPARVLFAALALDGHSLPPWQQGTGLLLLLRFLASAPDGLRPVHEAAGGLPTEPFVRRIEDGGGSVRLDARASRIVVEGGRATAVELASGERIEARRILSTLDPRTTLVDLVGAPRLPIRALRALRSVVLRSFTARLFAPELAPDARGGSESGPAPYRYLAPGSLRAMEETFDAAKSGALAASPWLSVTCAGDGGLAATVHWTPSELDRESRRRLLETSTRRLFGRARADEAVLVSAEELGRELGATGGCGWHGRMALESLFLLRPIPGWSGTETPFRGLSICGAGAHPGGGVTGLPGLVGARRALRALESG